MRGFETAATRYPASAIGFRRWSLSENHPENPCARFCSRLSDSLDEATTLTLAPSVCVRKIGRTG